MPHCAPMATAMNLAETRQKALVAVRDGNLSQAVELFHEAIRQQPAEVELYHELVDCHWAAYEFNQALATCEDALRICPESVATCILAAKKLFGIARFSESA